MEGEERRTSVDGGSIGGLQAARSSRMMRLRNTDAAVPPRGPRRPCHGGAQGAGGDGLRRGNLSLSSP